MFLTDAEIDAMCAGVTRNADKRRRLRAMGLIVNEKPNGRPLVVRSHAEAVLSGRADVERSQAVDQPRPTTGDTAAIIAIFGKKRTA